MERRTGKRRGLPERDRGAGGEDRLWRMEDKGKFMDRAGWRG